MAGLTAVRQVEVARQFEALHYTGDDGHPAADVFAVVGITLADGRQFYLPNGVRRTPSAADLEDGWPVVGFRARYDADELARKVRARGRVDLQYWLQIELVSLEQALADAAHREALERFELTGRVG